MRGEPPYELIYEALHGAGVYENYGTSRLIFDWLGDDGCDWLKTEYGENWECVAILEYCTVHFPSSALVTLAARIMVADFVSNNGFDAGYASRELIMLASGSEEVAILATNTRKKAGEAGARASRERRLQNLELLMQQIEQLSDAVGFFSEERIVEQALEKTVEKQKDFPKSQKTHADYGTALRSEEPFKSRYEAVFKKNA